MPKSISARTLPGSTARPFRRGDQRVERAAEDDRDRVRSVASSHRHAAA